MENFWKFATKNWMVLVSFIMGMVVPGLGVLFFYSYNTLVEMHFSIVILLAIGITTPYMIFTVPACLFFDIDFKDSKKNRNYPTAIFILSCIMTATIIFISLLTTIGVHEYDFYFFIRVSSFVLSVSELSVIFYAKYDKRKKRKKEMKITTDDKKGPK